MDDDWKIPPQDYKPFSLKRELCPIEAAYRNETPSLDDFQFWTKAQRKIYQKTRDKIRREMNIKAIEEIRDFIKIFDKIMKVDPMSKDSVIEMTRKLDRMARSFEEQVFLLIFCQIILIVLISNKSNESGVNLLQSRFIRTSSGRCNFCTNSAISSRSRTGLSTIYTTYKLTHVPRQARVRE